MSHASGPSQLPSPPRSEGLDALRGLAAVLVVALHAAMPYLLKPMPGLIWPVRDPAPSGTVDTIFWGIEGFIMPLFLLLSGYFALGMCQKLGIREFLAHRRRRLLGPLIFGAIFILPLDLYVWALGFVSDGRCTWKPLRTLKFPPEIARELWGLSHLWYLQYLIFCSVGLAIYVAIRNRVRRDEDGDPSDFAETAFGNGSGFAGLLIPFGLALLGTAVLFWEPNVVVGFQHSFAPVPPKFVYSALYFAAGVWLASRPQRVEAARRWSPVWLCASVPLLVTALPLIHRQQSESLAGTERLALAGLLALFAAATTLGLFGLSLRWNRPCPSAIRRLAEASFWIYLAHHPLVGLIQIRLSLTDWPALAKFLATIAIGVALTLATDHALVRNTWIGALLNGRRNGKSAPDPATAETTTERRAAA